MKANEDKHLDKFAAKLMKETSLQKPSAEFTSKVMMQALAASPGTATVYKPLISKPFWFIIFGAIILVMCYLFLSADVQSGGWFDSFNMGKVNDKFLNGLPDLKFSEMTVFAVALLTIMLFVQISFLKNYFNKRAKT